MWCSVVNSLRAFIELIFDKLTCWLLYFQAHPWFKGIEWDKLYQIKAAFIPEVNDELDTQNFEKFEEVHWNYMCKYVY